LTFKHPVKGEMMTFTAAAPTQSAWYEINL
jgi:hypothetical protein